MTETPLRATVSLRGIIFGPEGSVLVVERTSDGGWELPGGRLDAHEDCIDGLKREIREETGLDPVVSEPVHSLSWRNDSDNGRFAVYYRCHSTDRTVSLSDEHTDCEWVTTQTARDRLSEPQETGVDRAAEQTASSLEATRSVAPE
ncbi:NUDIX hydrolase [Halosimplex litoreum]|uniref:NUDIX hydrolase n=1 Tax=Halosimplex litoreum TaxID=1198301 RepID=A0A7T3KWG5_9EURY|nr:NUDIX hydrolase [Halosimplex litoreum]QPV64364.1 NUDIX hydrolase [Halosimplex litoreum]